MLETTRRGLFSYLAAALAWLIGRRAVIASTTADGSKDPGPAGPKQPDQPAVLDAGGSRTTTFVYSTEVMPMCPAGATLVYSTYLGGSPLPPIS